MPSFVKGFIFIMFYLVVLERIVLLIEEFFCTFLVVMYLCPNVKTLKRVCTFHTEICDFIHNYFHHGENQPRQEVEDSYIFENIFV